MEKDFFMRKAILLALKTGTNIGLNPPSGAVLVRDGNLLGEGFQQKQGGLNSILTAIESSVEEISGSTLYCTLEPACQSNNSFQDSVTAIIHAGIKRVIIGCIDPDEELSGKGIEALREAGIEVESGILEDDCQILIEKYRYFIHTKIPYIAVIQTATIDCNNVDDLVDPGNDKNINMVERINQLHSEFDSILLEAGTLFSGKRSLNKANTLSRDIFKIIIDVNLDYQPENYLFPKNDPEKTIILYGDNLNKEKGSSFIDKGLNLIPISINQDGLPDMFTAIKLIFNDFLISSIVVDGSTILITELLKLNVVNKLYYFVAPLFFANYRSVKASGSSSFVLQGIDVENIEIIGDRALFIGSPDFVRE